VTKAEKIIERAWDQWCEMQEDLLHTDIKSPDLPEMIADALAGAGLLKKRKGKKS